MALFIARPSRGSWSFFGLVALGLLALKGYRKREEHLVRRDGPVSEAHWRLMKCVLGSDARSIIPVLSGPEGPVRLDGPPVTDAQDWVAPLGARLRLHASATTDPAWPWRCADLAGAVAAHPKASERTRALAESVRSALRSGVGDHFQRLRLVDGDQLPRQLASLSLDVRGVSSGATLAWARGAPGAPTDVVAVSPSLPSLAAPTWAHRELPPRPGRRRAVQVPVELQLLGGVLLSSSSLVVWEPERRVLQRLSLAPDNISFLDDPSTVLGPARLTDQSRGAILRVEEEGQPSLVVPSVRGGLVPFPREVGLEEPFDGDDPDAWDAVEGVSSLGLLTSAGGTLSLRWTALEGPVRWSSPVTVGVGESALVGVLSADPAAEGGRYRVSVLRPGLGESVLEQFTVDSAGVVTGPRPMFGVTVPVVNARYARCTAGAVRYLAVAAEGALNVLRFEGDRVRAARSELRTERELSLTLGCHAERVLVASARGVLSGVPMVDYHLVDFHGMGEPSSGALTLPEAVTEGPRTPDEPVIVRGMALTGEGVVALVTNAGTLRSYLLPRGQLEGWTGGGLVFLRREASGRERTLTRWSVVSDGLRVAAMLEGELVTWVKVTPPTPPRDDTPAQPERVARRTPYVTVVSTTDGGRTWQTP